MNDELSRDEPARRRRPWYRWHWTTYLVLLLPLGFWTLLAVPGYTTSGEFLGPGGDVDFQEHGWPLVHMDRMAEDPDIMPIPPGTDLAPAEADFKDEIRSLGSLRWADRTEYRGEHVVDPSALPLNVLTVDSHVQPDWLHLSHWSQRGLNGQVIVHPLALVINLVAAALLCAAVVAPYEWWSRHRWHYSLRTLLGLFVVAAAVFGYARWLTDERNREEKVEGQLDDVGFSCSREYWGPKWLWRLVGPGGSEKTFTDEQLASCRLSMLWSIVSVDAPGQKARVTGGFASKPADEMAALQKMVALAAGLRHLRRIELADCSGRCVATVSTLKCVTDLDITGSGCTQETWAAIATMRQLESLSIEDTAAASDDPTPVTVPEDLSALQSLTNLKSLTLKSPYVRDASMGVLGRLIGLESLDIDAAISDTGLSDLQSLKNLRSLGLTSPDITDAGIGHLEHLTRLEHLEIGAPISPAALAHLKGLTRLNCLQLQSSNLTDAAVKDLQRALPNLSLLGCYPASKSWGLYDHAHRPRWSGGGMGRRVF